MYWERQRGNLCRLHSLNAFFGKRLLDDNAFYNYCDEYDSVIDGLKSREMDGFAEGRCIINYIVELLTNNYTLTVPIDSFENSREFVDIDRYNKLLNIKIIDYFEFNKNHIWYNKKYTDNNWYKIDSISGINRINPSLRGKNGFILVFRNTEAILNEMNYFRKLIKKNRISEVYLYNLCHSANKVKCYSKKFCNLKLELKTLLKLYRKNSDKINSQIKKIFFLIDIK